MKLRYSPTSPYVRKVTVTAIETGLDDDIERVPTNPWDPQTDLPDDNPLGRVPAVLTDEGVTLYDSPVICEYLDSLHDGPGLFPASGAARFDALRRQALGDGLLDAAALRFIETARRPEAYRWSGWIERQSAVVRRVLDRLEAEEVAGFGDDFDIGHVAIACGLGYVDFRAPAERWRESRPRLREWYESVAARPSLAQTVPRDPA